MSGNHLFQRLRKKWRFVMIALGCVAISFAIGTFLPGLPTNENPANAAGQEKRLTFVPPEPFQGKTIFEASINNTVNC